MYLVAVGFDPDLRMLPDNRLRDLQMFTLQTAINHCNGDTTVRQLKDHVSDEVRQRFGNHYAVFSIDPQSGEDLDMDESGESKATFAMDHDDIPEKDPSLFALIVRFINSSNTVH